MNKKMLTICEKGCRIINERAYINFSQLRKGASNKWN